MKPAPTPTDHLRDATGVVSRLLASLSDYALAEQIAFFRQERESAIDRMESYHFGKLVAEAVSEQDRRSTE